MGTNNMLCVFIKIFLIYAGQDLNNEKILNNGIFQPVLYLEELTELHKVFYSRQKRKIIPAKIASLVTSPLSIAVWYMDDGTLDYRPKSHYNFRLSTDSFTKTENVLLVDMLKVNFGVNASSFNSLCRGKKYNQLYIGAKGRNSFFDLVQPYMIKPCFNRKLPSF